MVMARYWYPALRLGFWLDIYIWLIIFRIVSTWINPYPQYSWLLLINEVTDPGYTLSVKLIQGMGVTGRDYAHQLILVILVFYLNVKCLLFRILPDISFHNSLP